MEILLNLAWAALAVAMVCAWLHLEDGSDRRRQSIAILVLIAILLPAISISDDLLAMQNATETDTCQRRDQLNLAGVHPLAPLAPAVLPAPLVQGVEVVNLGYASPPIPFLQYFNSSGLPAIQNRPPPAA